MMIARGASRNPSIFASTQKTVPELMKVCVIELSSFYRNI